MMISPQAAMPSRSWTVEPPDGVHVGGAEVTVSDAGVAISIDHARSERYQCGLDEYLTAVPLAGNSSLRDIVRRTLSDSAATEVADEVKRRLQDRPLRHVGEPTPRQPVAGRLSVLGVLLLMALAATAVAFTIWR